MEAAACTKYGPPSVLEVEDAERFVAKDNGILIRVHAANVI